MARFLLGLLVALARRTAGHEARIEAFGKQHEMFASRQIAQRTGDAAEHLHLSLHARAAIVVVGPCRVAA